MEYTNDGLGVQLTVIDRPTVRQQLRYKAALAQGRADSDKQFEVNWEAAKLLITDWKCEACPLDVDLDKATDKRIADVITWTGFTVFGHYLALDEIPKNS